MSSNQDYIRWLLQLPYEIQIEVLLSLPVESLKSICSTNTYFRNLCQDESIWGKLYQRDFFTRYPIPDNTLAATKTPEQYKNMYKTRYIQRKRMFNPNSRMYYENRKKILSHIGFSDDKLINLIAFSGGQVPYDQSTLSLLDYVSTIDPEIIDKYLEQL